MEGQRPSAAPQEVAVQQDGNSDHGSTLEAQQQNPITEVNDADLLLVRARPAS